MNIAGGKGAPLGEMTNNKIIVSAKEKTYIALNKPIGYTCTNRKFKGEQNIFALLPDEFKSLHVAGRLDKNSRGLVLLTNDGDYTMRITHPRFEHTKDILYEFARMINEY